MAPPPTSRTTRYPWRAARSWIGGVGLAGGDGSVNERMARSFSNRSRTSARTCGQPAQRVSSAGSTPTSRRASAWANRSLMSVSSDTGISPAVLEQVVQPEPGTLPALLDGRDRQAQKTGGLRLAQALVVEQVEDLAVGFRKPCHPLVELLPVGQPIRLLAGGGGLRVGTGPAGVVRTQAVRAVVVPGQVDQLPPDLFGRQAEELPRVGRAEVFQGPQEPQGRVLGHVRRLFPPSDRREAAEHLPSQSLQVARHPPQQFLAGCPVSGRHRPE